MTVFDGIVAVVVAAAAVLLIRSGFREWRNDDSYQPPARRFGLLVDERVAAGYDRSALLIGIGCGFIAIMMADVLTANLNDPGRAVSLIFAFASAGFILCAALSFLVVAFNRPRFLAPRRRRSEPGAFGHAHRPGAGLRGH
jgi:hypothetical protein